VDAPDDIEALAAEVAKQNAQLREQIARRRSTLDAIEQAEWEKLDRQREALEQKRSTLANLLETAGNEHSIRRSRYLRGAALSAAVASFFTTAFFLWGTPFAPMLALGVAPVAMGARWLAQSRRARGNP